MKLVDMKLPKGKKGDAPTEAVGKESPYPYGLHIRLEQETLDKLGLSKDDFDIDKPGVLKAEYRVTSIESHENENDSGTSIGLQIEKMAIGGPKPPARMTREELEGVE